MSRERKKNETKSALGAALLVILIPIVFLLVILYKFFAWLTKKTKRDNIGKLKEWLNNKQKKEQAKPISKKQLENWLKK